MIYFEWKKRLDEGKTPEEAILSKDEIWELARDFNLNLTDEEVDQLYEE